MPSVTATFDEVDDATGYLFMHGMNSLVNFTITPDAFTGVVVIEQTRNFQAWIPVGNPYTFTASSTAVSGAFTTKVRGTNYRMRAVDVTGGTAAVELEYPDTAIETFSGPNGIPALTVMESGNLITNSAPGTAETRGNRLFVPAGAVAKAGATAGWVVAAGDNVNLATLPASQTASTLVIPIIGLPGTNNGAYNAVVIKSFYLIGQIESAGGEVTVDAQFHSQRAIAADVDDDNLGSMTQIVATADTAITQANSSKDVASILGGFLVQNGDTFYVLVTATTAASTDIALQGVGVIYDNIPGTA